VFLLIASHKNRDVAALHFAFLPIAPCLLPVLAWIRPLHMLHFGQQQIEVLGMLSRFAAALHPGLGRLLQRRFSQYVGYFRFP
jgi:hypothetical protein